MIKLAYVLPLACLAASVTQTAQADDSTPARPATPLPGVTVLGNRIDDNYRVETVDSIGPLGSTPLLDIPYTVSVLPLDLIENSQAINFKDVSKYLPLVAYQEQQGPDILRPQTRGMQGGNFQNSRLDGMTMFVTVANAMEQFQQIEVVNGLSASLYGPANPSGMFNFVSKRPTQNDYREATVTYNSDSIGTGHLDVSGRFDRNGVVKYRFNGVFGEGDGFVEDSHQKRELGDLGIDIQPWESTVLELNFSDYRLTDLGYPGWFTYSEKIKLPSAPDPKLAGYNQEYLGTDLKTQISVARIKHDFSSNWHLVAGVLNQDATRNINTQVNNLTSNAGAYTSSMGSTFAPRFVITSDTAYLDGTFDTFGIAHDLTIGSAGYRASSYSLLSTPTAARLRLGTATIDSPEFYPYPLAGVVNANANFDSSDTYQQGVNIGDTLRFNQYWGARLGVSQDWFHVNNFNNKAARVTEYSNEGASPTASLLFKPQSSMTVYATFASSLQAGDLAPAGTANSGASLSPYRSKEYELGYKATFAKIDFTAAVFRIERPFANIDPADNVFKITGDQINKGLELSAVGEILPGLTMYGGLTLLNARLEDTPLASTDDKTYVGAPKIKGNTLFEYQIPAVPGLVAIFDYQFSGTRPGNDTNSLVVAGYNLFDLGARYTSQIASFPVTFRFTVDNLADRRYWSTVGPSNLTGANTGNLLAHLGSPRTVLASASVHF
ncbi:MAG TPA: TonB-dependent siderophore receptor [Steroidobacteraceae bacterium]